MSSVMLLSNVKKEQPSVGARAEEHDPRVATHGMLGGSGPFLPSPTVHQKTGEGQSSVFFGPLDLFCSQKMFSNFRFSFIFSLLNFLLFLDFRFCSFFDFFILSFLTFCHFSIFSMCF